MHTRRWGRLAVAWVLVCLALVYGGDIGRGFVKDDFGWILHSPLRSPADVRAAFTTTPMGFYRPLVALSFGLDARLFGLEPLAYGWTNLLFAAGTAVLVAAAVRSIGFGWTGGAFAAFLWAFNVHGINMALLWTSGRTSLIAALGAAAAMLAFTRHRFVPAGICTLAALLGKEEPLLLPLVFAIWAWIDARGEGLSPDRAARRAARAAAPACAAVLAYLLLRAQTDAFTPATAPDVYRLRPAVIGANVLQYLDRSLTFTAAVLLLGWAGFARVRVRLDAVERRTCVKGAVWLVLGFALTIMIASRSSLYVVFPSIGSALIGIAVGRAIWRAVPPPRRPAAVAAALALPLALWPLHHARNTRLKDEALLSAAVVSRLQAEIAARPETAAVVVYDDPAARPSASSAFGEKLPDAVALATGKAIPAVIVPDPAAPPPGDPATLALRVGTGITVIR